MRLAHSRNLHSRLAGLSRLVASGAILFGLGGCLGPNPGFFVSSSVANASIFALVNSLLSAALGLGGG